MPQKEIVKIALELYKRRIPQHVEKTGEGSSLTMIKIIKNHVPEGYMGDTIETTPIEKAAEVIISKTTKELNDKLQQKREARLSPTARQMDNDRTFLGERDVPDSVT